MTPSRQFAESVKYTARPIILIPASSGEIVIMEAFGARREYICTLPPAELARWAKEDFARQTSLQKEAMRPKIPNLDLDKLDFIL